MRAADRRPDLRGKQIGRKGREKVQQESHNRLGGGWGGREFSTSVGMRNSGLQIAAQTCEKQIKRGSVRV
jgi:hypothetical protein